MIKRQSITTVTRSLNVRLRHNILFSPSRNTRR